MLDLSEPVEMARRRTEKEIGDIGAALAFAREIKRLELKRLMRLQHQALKLKHLTVSGDSNG